mmetsp:Transcript_43772/g.91345  ORF Transcript_43772/g.91345 Transcript_43772/m.91345 type:complete len:432 (+) Transcript_43772:3-1298(+)
MKKFCAGSAVMLTFVSTMSVPANALQRPAWNQLSHSHRSHDRSSLVCMARASRGRKSSISRAAAGLGSKATSGKGFAAKTGTTQISSTERALVDQGKSLRRLCNGATDPLLWLSWAGAAAEIGEYAEARQILEFGCRSCGTENSASLVAALGQMRRKPQDPEIAAQSTTVDWPGRADTSEYVHGDFMAYSVPEAPTSCPRGSVHASGETIVFASASQCIPAEECQWVVSEVERVAGKRWVQDNAEEGKVGADDIWAKPFPDRLWLREVPGLVDWFDHRLRTRLFPMLQKLYPSIIHSPDELRCHDAFVVRYDADGMSELELHQDTTSFSFTVALNGKAEYDGGGTVFPALRSANDGVDTPFTRMSVKTDVGGVCSFPGRLWHGGNRVTRGYRYIIPVFVYLDYNKSRKPRGHLLRESKLAKSDADLLHFPY